MISIISGKKGKGKTKYLLAQVNEAVVAAHGSIVYLDKSAKHMYELNNKVRLINVSEYPLNSSDAFIGFLCGVLSQDSDIEKIYIDSFLKVSCLEGMDMEEILAALTTISEQFNVDLILSVSLDEAELPKAAKSCVTLSL